MKDQKDILAIGTRDDKTIHIFYSFKGSGERFDKLFVFPESFAKHPDFMEASVYMAKEIYYVIPLFKKSSEFE